MGWNKPIIKNVQTAIAKPVKYISLCLFRGIIISFNFTGLLLQIYKN